MIDDFQRPPAKSPAPIDGFLTPGHRPSYPQPARIDTPTPAPPTPLASSTARPDFVPPEQVAANDDISSVDLASMGVTPAQPRSTGRTFTLFGKWDITVTKKTAIIAGAVAAVLISGGAIFALTHHSAAPVKPAPVAPKKVITKPTPAPIVSPLTGVPVSLTQKALPVTAVMIENSPDARPQSGLKDAGVVYEAIAEAGITRFMAVYQEAEPGNIGPVRSARPYYLRWALPYEASYAHVGGSPDALNDIKVLGVRDLDQFYNSSAYHRVSSRYAPHNVYTSIASLRTLEQGKGYMQSNFTGFVRKAEQAYKAPTATTPKAKQDTRKPATAIDFAISGAYYNVHYDYDATANSYKRSEGGAPHMDADSNTQLEPKAVVALVMPYSLMSDGYHSSYNTIGTGPMLVFQDGTVTTGTWSKADDKAQFSFLGADNKPLALNPGQTWITALGDSNQATYK